LDDYQRISVNSNPSAGVRIDGNFIGTTPLIIMQPRGLHSVRVEKNGYRTIDTAVMVGAGDSGVCTFTLAEIRSADSEVPNNAPVYGNEKVIPRLKSDLKPFEGKIEVSEQSVSSSSYSEEDFRDAELLESNNWRAALELYRKVFENPHTSQLKKEAALFSVAKLEAEHGRDTKSAREAFLHYLALYPTGNFVGESWLRLAELEFEHNQNKAIDYYQRYFERFPRHSRISELQYRVGLIYLQNKKYDEAISMFKLSLANYQGSDAIEKDKIKTSLVKALKEKNENNTSLPANASGMAP
jgi:tetratricopeptide (TPR) repeat protein